MSSAGGVGTAGYHRPRKPYPEPDLSKTYTSVPPVRVAKRHPFARWLTRLGAEFAWEALSPSEKRAAKAIFAAIVLVLALLSYTTLRRWLK